MSYYLPYRPTRQKASLVRDLSQVLMGATSDAVIIIDIDGRIENSNAIACQLSGWPNAQMKNQLFSEVFRFASELDPQKTIHLLGPTFDFGQFSNQKRTLLISKDGTEYTTDKTVVPTFDTQGNRSGTVIILQDITKLKNLGLQIRWHCNHDAITGLDNRFAFEEKLTHTIETIKHHDGSYVLCHLDIDQFKLLNDTYGSLAGDQLLGQIAVVLQEKLRPGDTLARIGGDDFVILFQDCSLDQAHRIAIDIQHQVEQFDFLWKGKSFSVGISMGLVPIKAPSLNVDTLLKQAETACFTAKTIGKNQIQVFALDNMQISDLKHHQEWSFIIRDALKEGRFQLYRQPIVSSTNIHEPHQHFEVLVRMLSSSNQIIAPNSFISTAERYQLMPALDQWIVEKCLANLEMAALEHPSDQSSSTIHSINLSGTSFGADHFLDYLIDRIAHLKIPQQRLCFEITETAAIADLSRTREFMQALRSLGCSFSLDDFGAGMSSFRYLKKLPVDFLKIDGSFIREMKKDDLNYSIVESISTIGHKLGLKTIAEMVEDQATIQCLQKIGVNFIQGFVISKPLPWI